MSVQSKIGSDHKARIKQASNFTDALCKAVSLIPEFGIDTCCEELGPILQKMMRSDATLRDAQLMLRSADQAVIDVAANVVNGKDRNENQSSAEVEQASG